MAGDIYYTGGLINPTPYLYYLGGGYESAVTKRDGTPQIANKVFDISFENTGSIASATDKEAPKMILALKNTKNCILPDQIIRIEACFCFTLLTKRFTISM